MRLDRLALPLALALACTAPVARAQGHWIAGPLGGANGADNTIFALANWDPDGPGPSPAQLVAGGVFGSIEGVPAGHVAARDPLTGDWRSLGDPSSPALAAHALTVYQGDLVAGGSFTSLGGQPVSRVARWDGAAWTGLGGVLSGTVHSLAIHEGRPVIGGLFTSLAGSPNLVAYVGVSLSSIGTGGTDASVHTLASTDGKLYAGGGFTTAGGIPAASIAVWNGASWSELDGGATDIVFELVPYMGEVLAGGFFDYVDNGTIASPSAPAL